MAPRNETGLQQQFPPREAAGAILAALLIPFFELCRVGKFWIISSTADDNPSYIQISDVILQRGGLIQGQHFWGFPALIAAFRWGLGISGVVALVSIAVVFSLAAAFLIYRLYGFRAAVALFALSPAWLRTSVLGGSEPLFMFLLLLSWLAFRVDCAVLAVAIGSLATTVRPVGVFAVCAFLFLMVRRREWRRLTASVLSAGAVGLAYFGSLQFLSGDPFLNFKRYSGDWRSGMPLTLPFGAFGRSFQIILHDRWTNSAVTFIGLALFAFGALALLRNRKSLSVGEFHAEVLFVTFYLCFLACYNHDWVLSAWPRFSIPVLPFLLFAADNWLPRRRITVWLMTSASALLVAAEAIGFKAVFGISLRN
jgi:hypothetical protein